MSLYKTLGLEDESVDMKGIRKAYLKMSKKHHPDKGGDEEDFKELGEAYRILSDPELRKMYDEGCSPAELAQEADTFMNKVFAIFEEVLQSHGFVPDHTDLFKLMRELCNEKDLKMERDIESVENEIKNLISIQERMGNADIFKTYLDNTKASKAHRITLIEKEKVYISRILDFIENCDYEVDEDDEDGEDDDINPHHPKERLFSGGVRFGY